MRVKWKGGSSDWNSPLFTMTTPPTWAGDAGNTGGIFLSPEANGTISVTAYTGGIVVNRTGTILHADLVITPVKELNISEHFTRDRYTSHYAPLVPVSHPLFSRHPMFSVWSAFRERQSTHAFLLGTTSMDTTARPIRRR